MRRGMWRLGVLAVAVLLAAVPGLLGPPTARAARTSLSATDTSITWGAREKHLPQNNQVESPMATNPTDGLNSITGANDLVNEPDCDTDPSTSGSVCSYSPTAAAVAVYLTRDGGSSWSLQSLDWKAAGLLSASDPSVAFGPKPDGHGGFSYASGARAYFASMAVPFGAFSRPLIAVAGSDDGGRTWAAPVVATSRTNATSMFNDKEMIWADSNPASPSFGNVYVAWTLFTGASVADLNDTILFTRSTDGGATWDKPVTLSPSYNNEQVNGRQAAIVRTDRQGRVIVVWLDAIQKQPVMVASISEDGGQHFGARVVIGPVADLPTPLPGSSFRNDSFASLDVDQSSGAIYAAWSDYRRVDSTHGHGVVTIKKSTDRGTSWSAAGTIDLAGRTPFQPSLAVARQGAAPPTGSLPGRVVVGFTALTDVPLGTPPVGGSVNYLPFVTGSDDGGGSWSAPATPGGARRSDPAGAAGPPSPFFTIDLSQQFLGDYSGLSAAPDGKSFYFSYTSAQDATPCKAIDDYRTGAGPLPNVYAACSPTFGNSGIHVAVVKTGP